MSHSADTPSYIWKVWTRARMESHGRMVIVAAADPGEAAQVALATEDGEREVTQLTREGRIHLPPRQHHGDGT